jgi:hypothetical protein
VSSALTAREYSLAFTVLKLTSRQNSALTSRFAMTSGLEIEYFGKKPQPKPLATMAGAQSSLSSVNSFAIDAAGIEHGIHHVVELAIGLQHITRAREIRYLDGGLILI